MKSEIIAVAAVVSLCAACKKAPPCGPLEALAARAARAPQSERPAVVSRGLVDACGQKLPEPWRLALEAAARSDREGMSAALADAMADDPLFFEEQCEDGVRGLRGLGAVPAHRMVAFVARSCRFSEEAYATEAEVLSADGSSPFENLMLAPAIFTWLVDAGYPREQARALARALGGIPGRLATSHSELDVHHVKAPGNGPRAQVAVGISSHSVKVGKSAPCEAGTKAHVFELCEGPSQPLAKALANARKDSGDERPVAALWADRKAPFDAVAMTLEALDRQGFEKLLILRGSDSLWFGVPLTPPGTHEAGEAGPAPRLRIDAAGFTLTEANGRSTTASRLGEELDFNRLNEALSALKKAEPSERRLVLSASADTAWNEVGLLLAWAVDPEGPALFPLASVETQRAPVEAAAAR